MSKERERDEKEMRKRFIRLFEASLGVLVFYGFGTFLL